MGAGRTESCSAPGASRSSTPITPAESAALLQSHGESLVVRVEDEVLGDRGPIQAMASRGQNVLACPGAESLRFPMAREDLDLLVDFAELLGDRDHVERVPA